MLSLKLILIMVLTIKICASLIAMGVEEVMNWCLTIRLIKNSYKNQSEDYSGKTEEMLNRIKCRL